MYYRLFSVSSGTDGMIIKMCLCHIGTVNIYSLTDHRQWLTNGWVDVLMMKYLCRNCDAQSIKAIVAMSNISSHRWWDLKLKWNGFIILCLPSLVLSNVMFLHLLLRSFVHIAEPCHSLLLLHSSHFSADYHFSVMRVMRNEMFCKSFACSFGGQFNKNVPICKL